MSAAKAIVIGSGIAGLATAIRLSVKGYAVTIVEKNNYAGGKIACIEKSGYHFDIGPSLLTEPELIDQLFVLCGEHTNNFLAWQRVSESCRYFFENGKVVKGFADADVFAREMESKIGEDPILIKKYLLRAALLYDKIGKVFLENSLNKKDTWLSLRSLNALAHTRPRYLFSTLNSFNKQHFLTTEAVQIFNRFATYNGSDPFRAPAMLNMISHLEFNQGIFYPKGGMHVIAEALYKLALRKGVDIKLGCMAQEIIHAKGKVLGVQTIQGKLNAKIIVCNSDVYYGYRDLLKDKRQSDRIATTGRSTSALIFCWGISQSFPQLHLHNIFFSSNYQQEFLNLSCNDDLFEDPTVYVNITAKLDANHSPPGKENWFVMINMPPLKKGILPVSIEKARKIVLEKLTRMLSADIEKLIESEEIIGPSDIERNTGAFAGALYGTHSNFIFSAFKRHPNFSKKYRGLFFAGGTVHPGGGIPLCLKSAKIVSDLVPDS